MKKTIALGGLYLLALIQSCCPNEGFTTRFITIESARGLFYSFDQNGVFPYLDEFNRAELGISVLADSTSERIEVSQLFTSMINGSYACENPSRTDYENTIDSINVFTKYDFLPEYPAGSNVNEILKPLDILGEITDGISVNNLVFIRQHMKFSQAPTFDSMQFVITGRILEKSEFSIETDLVILTN